MNSTKMPLEEDKMVTVTEYLNHVVKKPPKPKP